MNENKELNNINFDDCMELIMSEFNKIENYRVYYTFRLMKLKWITERVITRMKACLALHNVGFPITTRLIKDVTGQVSTSTIGVGLHLLGDKKCLVLLRKNGKEGNNMWIVSPLFLKYYNGDY